MTVSKVENVIVMLLCTRQPLGYVLVRQLLDKQIITRKCRILLLLANGVLSRYFDFYTHQCSRSPLRSRWEQTFKLWTGSCNFQSILKLNHPINPIESDFFTQLQLAWALICILRTFINALTFAILMQIQISPSRQTGLGLRLHEIVELRQLRLGRGIFNFSEFQLTTRSAGNAAWMQRHIMAGAGAVRGV